MDPTMVNDSVTNVASNIGEFVSSAMSWMGDVFTYISTHPILFTLVVAVPLVGLGVGLVKRLTSI